MKHHAIPLITELDMTTMVSAPPVGKPSKPAPTWVISKKKIQPAPQPEPEKIPVEKETDTPPAVVGGTGTWVPAAQTARKPRWTGNFISPGDYPLVARQEGNDGRVILQVHIDTEGRVQEVKLLQGSCEVLNEVAIRKVKNGIFSPAYDAQGAPVACEVILPIRFQLK
ncbi:MAG: energy transducer TonB [Endomicrobiales bacterium]